MTTAQNSPTENYWLGKAAVVTGGARGQGASIAKMLLRAGAWVYVMDRLPMADPAWQALQQFADNQRGMLTCLALDVADPEAWTSVAARIQSDARPLMGMVNNAGITGPRNTVTKASLEEWELVLRINLTGAFLGIHTLAPLMHAGASIVNISSTVGLTGYYSAAYSTSKWALRGLTKSAAMELAPHGVRVNCVCPGVVDTEMIRNNARLFEALQGITPMGRMAAPDQIAEVMFFLLSPQSSYVTGTDIAVDGGVTAGGIFWPVGLAVGALQVHDPEIISV
jgi:NAD(P)-dependent dehydrogenase (short-subunit alcohol dehydrogenase family)